MANFKRTPLVERLESRLDKSPASGCWLYLGARLPRGYGIIGAGGKRKKIYAHRAAWIVWRGPIPEGMHVCHRCDNPPCCNPDHLFLGTRSDNMRDCVQKNRLNVGDRRGTNNGRAKLSEEQVREIRECYAKGGVSQSQLAAKFNIWQTHISRIIRRQAWGAAA